MKAPARLLAAALAALPAAAPAHDVVDPGRMEQALAEVAGARRRALEPDADPEALYRLGERAEAMVELLNLQAAAHGEGDVLCRLVADRLRALGVETAFSQPERLYAYDLAAFREYLRRAPSGPRAPAAWRRLLARAFHQRAGDHPAALAGGGVEAAARAAAEEERFLERYPADEGAGQVRFFLAVDYYRLAVAEGASQRARYRRLGREALRRVRESLPGTMESRTAEALLDDLARR